VVLDAGECKGAPSTVVDCTGEEAKLLRAGRIPWDDVLAVLST
jgi:tRNA A37 threonylcarbamoyladenosine synthetase subunit TsaC/SUA5/YrdC